MKRLAIMVVVLALATGLLSSVAMADGSYTERIVINKEKATVTVNLGDKNYQRVKVVIKKGEKRYIYNIYSQETDLPLQMGSGLYNIAVYERITGTHYRELSSKTAIVDIDDVNVFLQDTQDVSISSSPEAVIKAKEITTIVYDEIGVLEVEELTDMQKLELIHGYVVSNIKYDSEKARTVSPRYLPNTDQILESGIGICYDYSSLMAVMLRSLDIPTKLVKGYTTYTQSYHAWNEVYINGSWLVVDATTDVALIEENMKNNMIKEKYYYLAKYEF